MRDIKDLNTCTNISSLCVKYPMCWWCQFSRTNQYIYCNKMSLLCWEILGKKNSMETCEWISALGESCCVHRAHLSFRRMRWRELVWSQSKEVWVRHRHAASVSDTDWVEAWGLDSWNMGEGGLPWEDMGTESRQTPPMCIWVMVCTSYKSSEELCDSWSVEEESGQEDSYIEEGNMWVRNSDHWGWSKLAEE